MPEHQPSQPKSHLQRWQEGIIAEGLETEAHEAAAVAAADERAQIEAEATAHLSLLKEHGLPAAIAVELVKPRTLTGAWLSRHVGRNQQPQLPIRYEPQGAFGPHSGKTHRNGYLQVVGTTLGYPLDIGDRQRVLLANSQFGLVATPGTIANYFHINEDIRVTDYEFSNSSDDFEARNSVGVWDASVGRTFGYPVYPKDREWMGPDQYDRAIEWSAERLGAIVEELGLTAIAAGND